MSEWDDKIVIEQGDLSEADVDAIVNAANNDLQLGGGVAAAIRVKGGPSIQQECDAIGRIPVGEAAITSGGNLKTRHVIHAASMSFGALTSAESLRTSTHNSLLRAKENGLQTIAFPAVGTGIAGFPIRVCAEIMLDEAVKHLQGHTSVRQVRFVLFDANALEEFVHVWNAQRGGG